MDKTLWVIPPGRTIHLAPSGPDLAVCIVETLANAQTESVEVRTAAEAKALVIALATRFRLPASVLK